MTGTDAFKSRKRSHPPNLVSKKVKGGGVKSGRPSSHGSDQSQTKDGSRLSKHQASNVFVAEKNHEDAFKKRVNKMFKNVDLDKAPQGFISGEANNNNG